MERAAHARGLRLVTTSRPGYGGSTRQAGRAVVDVVADTEAVLRHLGADRCLVAGWSGGGPHALACAARLDAAAAVVVIAGVAPYEAEGLDFLAGMGEENVVEFGAALQGRDAIEAIAREQAAAMLELPGSELIETMHTLVSPVDAEAMGRGFGDYWAAMMPDVFAQGHEGWLDDDMAFVAPFGFRVQDIAVPTLVWQGRQDLFVPVGHGEWLARHIPGAEARIAVDDGHLTLSTDRIPEVHAWLLRRFPA
jgi:pimeloyl-ACP methyl ester carboxylesterase